MLINLKNTILAGYWKQANKKKLAKLNKTKVNT